MFARDAQSADEGTQLEVLPPVLFNTFKHHAGALRARIAKWAARGEEALSEANNRLALLGTRLMDLYAGTMTPREVSAWALDELRKAGRDGLPAYRDWLAGSDQYATITHPEGTAWVLRLGDEEARYVHLHPGRHSPNTTRVRATVLKTAFVAHLWARVRGGDPMDRRLLNAVRGELLGLAPLGRAPQGDEGLGAVIELLR